MATMSPILNEKAKLQNLLTKLAKNDAQPTESVTLPAINAGNKNTAPIAAKFLIAEQMRSFANKNYDVVKAEAKEAGILGTDEDYIEGELRTVSSFAGFDITAKKAAATQMPDSAAVRNVISKYVPANKRDQALQEAFKERKGTVTISVNVR